MTPQRRHYTHLDMLRGLAALAVVVGYTRGFLYIDYRDIAVPHIGHMVFYVVTGLGHEAVIACFALSGFLVGGNAAADMLDGRWSWPHYIVARLARLWCVVVPALLLTMLWDGIGQTFGGAAGYSGPFAHLLASGPTPAAPADYRLSTLVGNALFLQTILVPTFGSNGPFWSLAYEFRYFVPLVAAAVLVPAPAWVRLATGGAGVAIAAILPSAIVVLALVWIAGAAAHWWMSRPGARAMRDRILAQLTSLPQP